MDVQLITQADFVLSRCGRPVAPSGLSVVYIPKSFLIQNFFAVTPTTLTQSVMKEITGRTPWCLRAISFTSSTTTGLSVQIQLPNGKFLINNLQDVLQIAGYGSMRYLFTRELECPPGSKITVTFNDTNTAVAQPLAIEFEGAYKYLLRSGAGQVCTVADLAANLPRIFGDFNENIMAPCWQLGVGPSTPKGFKDQGFVYAAQGATLIDVANGPFTATQVIPIDADSDFRCRKVYAAILADGTVTAGNILAKIRTGSGYSFTDDYLDVATYLNNAPFPVDWKINAADNVFADLQFVNDSGGAPGTGNISFQLFLEGVKRWKKAA